MMVGMEVTFADGFTARRWGRDEESAIGYLEAMYSDRHGEAVNYHEVEYWEDEID